MSEGGAGGHGVSEAAAGGPCKPVNCLGFTVIEMVIPWRVLSRRVT